ncbi:MAG: amidohydrolase family protein [Planctomycetaceae bacterium]
MIIDSHQHFWQLDLPFEYDWLRTLQHQKICRNYLPEDLVPHLTAAGVDASVFVQTQHNLDENRWALSLAQANPFIAGIVGWVDLASTECEDQLQEFLEDPLFVGVRHITQDEPDDDFILRMDVLQRLKVLEKHQIPFDLLFYTRHLKHAVSLAQLLPELPMVIDHLSKPNIEDASIADWSRDLKAAAAYPNLYCKLSGMITEANWNNWTVDDLRPYVFTALEAFGAERCMFGSDWPVCELAGTYQQVFDALNQALGEISESEREQIFGKTAASFYKLRI